MFAIGHIQKSRFLQKFIAHNAIAAMDKNTAIATAAIITKTLFLMSKASVNSALISCLCLIRQYHTSPFPEPPLPLVCTYEY